MEEKLAEMLVEYSLGITSSDVVVIDYQNHTRKLFDALKKKIYYTGAKLEAFPRQPLATLIDLDKLDKIVNRATAYLKLGGGEYKNPLKEEVRALQRKEGEIMKKRCELKWVLTPYPSEYMAGELNIPLEDLRNTYFKCCFVDYEDQRKIQRRIASQFEQGEVSIKGSDTDLRLRIIENPHFCNGKINVPDGEVFWEIDPYRTEGSIRFDIPFIYGPARFKQIYLAFRKGKVVEYDSNQRNQLKVLLETDEGALYLGEFGIGTNPKARIIGHSFIDEKVKGTFHLALGSMSLSLESRLHMDMVKTLEDCGIRNNGRVIDLS